MSLEKPSKKSKHSVHFANLKAIADDCWVEYRNQTVNIEMQLIIRLLLISCGRSLTRTLKLN